MKYSGLFTDFYELTMMQGYMLQGKNEDVVFDMFFRRQPFSGGYSIFTGLSDILDILENIHFSKEDLSYLKSLKVFKDNFLEYLKDFKFTGSVYAMDEGAIIFPNEPIIRIHSNIIEAQLIESLILNTINFQTLIATKAARVSYAAEESTILEFGLRRAQGFNGSLSASRAAFIGGADATSNTLAGKIYGIPVKGSMAHSWIMAFDSELEAFRKFTELYPDSTILLIDTYDTLGSGIENAIIVGLEQKKIGKCISVRLDSGDFFYLSREIRKRLDEAGLNNTKIVVSNDLDEEIIHQLLTDGASIDTWGVGTNLVTGGTDSSFGGVYKLAAKKVDNKIVATIKVSNNAVKTTNPGIKQVYRFFNKDGSAAADLIALAEEDIPVTRPYTFYHPMYFHDKFTLSNYGRVKAMLSIKMKEGKRLKKSPPIIELQNTVKNNLKCFDTSYKRIINPHIYKVSLSEKLKSLKAELLDEYK
ncbi:MAG: nicotinate phosphoribosyltransferase [Spirochaetales bacterium]|nr:nicotinate phosphoribosyltransferase [Spirochaetales bacterium]